MALTSRPESGPSSDRRCASPSVASIGPARKPPSGGWATSTARSNPVSGLRPRCSRTPLKPSRPVQGNRPRLPRRGRQHEPVLVPVTAGAARRELVVIARVPGEARDNAPVEAGVARGECEVRWAGREAASRTARVIAQPATAGAGVPAPAVAGALAVPQEVDPVRRSPAVGSHAERVADEANVMVDVVLARRVRLAGRVLPPDRRVQGEVRQPEPDAPVV